MRKTDDAAAETEPAGARRSSQSLAAGVYERLRQMLKDGQLKPGMRVREIEIADAMRVSRTPVREALSRLQTRGLIELSGGGLSVVAFSRSQIIELYAVRGVLEGAAARFAAEHAFISDLTKLRYVSTLFARHQDDPAAFAKINTAFHEAIYEAAHNRYQERMLEDLNDYLALLPNTTFAVHGRIASAQQEHERILTAIERRDPEEAEQAARDHIRKALDARLELMFAPK